MNDIYDRLLTTKQVSKILNVTPKSLANARYTKTGINITYVKIGKSIRYYGTDVIDYIEQNTHKFDSNKEEEEQ